MTVEQEDTIDFVAHDPGKDEVLLVMVQDRPCGESGRQLHALEDKFNTYLNYATEQRLVQDYPDLVGKPVHIQPHTVENLGPREFDFLRIVTKRHLGPLGIRCSWRLIDDNGEHGI